MSYFCTLVGEVLHRRQANGGRAVRLAAVDQGVFDVTHFFPGEGYRLLARRGSRSISCRPTGQNCKEGATRMIL
jgi:hypothetical protein